MKLPQGWVYQKRKIRGWSQKDVATAGGMSQQAVSKAERNMDVGWDVLFGLARAFGMTIESLCQEADIDAPPTANQLRAAGATPAVIDLIERLQNLTPEEQGFVADVIQTMEQRKVLGQHSNPLE